MANTGLGMVKVHWARREDRTACGRTLLDIIVPRHTTDAERVTCAKCMARVERHERRMAEWMKRQSAEAN